MELKIFVEVDNEKYKSTDNYRFKYGEGEWKIPDALLEDIVNSIQDPENQIRQTFEEFIEAIRDGDFAKAQSISAEDSQAFTDEEEFKSASSLLKDVEFSISGIKVDGDTATGKITMLVEFAGENNEISDTAFFKKEGGKWKLAQLNSQ